MKVKIRKGYVYIVNGNVRAGETIVDISENEYNKKPYLFEVIPEIKKEVFVQTTSIEDSNIEDSSIEDEVIEEKEEGIPKKKVIGENKAVLSTRRK